MARITSFTIINGEVTVVGSGNANDVIMSGGSMHVYRGGYASRITVRGGEMSVGNNGSVENTLIERGASMAIEAGGIANSVTINSGALHVAGGSARNISINKNGFVHASNGAMLSSVGVNSKGSMMLNYLGSACEVTIEQNGVVTITGGEMCSAIISNGGQALVNGSVRNATIKGGSLHLINSSAEDIMIESGNAVVSNGTMTRVRTDENGMVHLQNGVISSGSNGGKMYCSGGTVAEIEQGGAMYVMEGGSGINVSQVGGYGMHVYGGGKVTSTFILGGEQVVKADGISLSPFVQHVIKVSSGGVASGGAVYNNGVASICEGGLMSGFSIGANGSAHVLSKGMACDFVISGASENGDTGYGKMTVVSGGAASGGSIGRYGQLFVSGIASGLSVCDEGMAVINGAASNMTVSNDGIIDVAGGVLSDVTVESNGVLSCGYNHNIHGEVIGSSGMVCNMVVNKGGEAYAVHGANLSNATINSGGSMEVRYTTNKVVDLLVSKGGSLYISGNIDSSIIENVTMHGNVLVDTYGRLHHMSLCSGASLTINLRGIVQSTTIDPGTTIIISSGGRIEEPTMSDPSARLAVSDGAVCADAHMSNGVITISSNGLMERGELSGGTLVLADGGVASNVNIILGTLNISHGGSSYRNSMTESGTITVAGMDTSSVISEGCIEIESGGTAFGTTLTKSALMYVVSGGMAEGIIMSGGTASAVSGGVVRGARISSGMMCCVEGGRMSGGEICSGANSVYCSNSGVLEEVSINGRASIGSGGIVSKCLIGGMVEIFNDATKILDCIIDGGVSVYDGVVNAVGLNVRGYLELSGWGRSMTAAGWATIDRGGSALVRDYSTLGNVTIWEGGHVTVNGSEAKVMSATVDGGLITVMSSGSLDNSVLNFGGIDIVSGGCANNIHVINGTLTIDTSDTVTGIVINGEWNALVKVNANAEVGNITMPGVGRIEVYGSVGSINMNDGHAELHGYVDTITGSGGVVSIRDGGNAGYIAGDIKVWPDDWRDKHSSQNPG